MGGASRVVGALWRASLLTAMQYRGDFMLQAVMGLLWCFWTVTPLVFVFGHTESVAGWSYPQSMLVLAFFLFLKGLLEAFVEPNLRHLVAMVRDGTLDFLLLKPADAQILVSLGHLTPGRVVDLLAASGLAAWALRQVGHTPSFVELAAAAVCLVASVLILYSIWLMAAATSFWWVRVESLSFLLGAVLDAGRWPSSVYRGLVRVLLTFVVPVTLMTSFPALALQGLLEPAQVLGVVAGAAGFLGLSRFVWRRALARYTSASS